MHSEKHTFSCHRYRKQNVTITEYYDIINNQQVFKYATCSLRDSSPKYQCDGMEEDDIPCPNL